MKVTIFHGKTHFFDWAMFNSYVTHDHRLKHRDEIERTYRLLEISLIKSQKRDMFHGQCWGYHGNVRIRHNEVDMSTLMSQSLDPTPKPSPRSAL